MATDPKAALRSQRAYLKRKHIAQSELAGAEILDVTIAVRASDGHFVIRLHDDTDLHLDLRPELEPVTEITSRQKQIYAPKSWDAAKWNGVVATMQKQTFTKDDAHSGIKNAATLDEKQIRQAHAVIEAMPDTPDWYTSLPVAEV